MDIIWILTAIIGLLIVFLVWTLLIKDVDYWKERGIPQMEAYPLVGSMLDVVTGEKTLIELITKIYRVADGKEYIGFMLFQKPALVIRDIDLINQVLIKDFSYFQDRFAQVDENTDLIGAGMPHVSGDKWRVLRHKLTPTFTSGKMKMMFSQIKECSNEVVLYLKEKVGKDVDSRVLSFKFVLNVIGKIAFGVNVDALNEKTEKENEFYQNSKHFFHPSIFLQLKFLLFITVPKINNFLKLKLVSDKVNGFFQKLTQDLIDYRENSGEKRNDFLQIMLEKKAKEIALLSAGSNSNAETREELFDDTFCSADEPEDLELLEHLKNVKYDKNATVFTNQIIAGQTFVFIAGGSETVAAVLSFVMYELAVNNDVQARLQEEVDGILNVQEMSYEAIRKMKYLEQVINEVIRLRPPGGLLTRECTEDYTLPGTNVTIKKGQFVCVPVKAIHTDPQYFAEPEKFNPDRFEDMNSIPKGVFFPFGGGPRICIAMRLAMLEMKTFLATLVANYNIVLSDKTQLPLELNKKSIIPNVVGGIWIRVEPRNK